MGSVGNNSFSSNFNAGGPKNKDNSWSSSSKSTSTDRSTTITTKNGDVVGRNFVIPGGDFTHFLGYAKPTTAELTSKALSGGRVIEIVLQKELEKIAKKTMKDYPKTTGMGESSGALGKIPGREGDTLKNELAARREVFGEANPKAAEALKEGSLGSSSSAQYMKLMNEYQAQSREDNMLYLEMQYKYYNAERRNSTISNLMKVRHDAISRSIHESK